MFLYIEPEYALVYRAGLCFSIKSQTMFYYIEPEYVLVFRARLCFSI